MHISCVYYLLSQRFLYLMTVKLPNMRNNLLEEMNLPIRLHCLKKQVLSKNFHWRQKRRVKNFFDGKRIWQTRGQQYSGSYFCFCVCCCFSCQQFPFQNAFYYFIGKIFFNRSLPIQKYLSDGKFSSKTVYLPKECLLNK